MSELLASDDACTSTPRHSKTSSKRTVLIFHCEYSSERAPKLYVSVFICLLRIGHKSAPIQLAQCWFPGLAISSAKIFIYFSNKIYGSDFVEQHTETVMVWNYENADCCLRKKILCQLWLFSAHFRPPYFDTARLSCWASVTCCGAAAAERLPYSILTSPASRPLSSKPAAAECGDQCRNRGDESVPKIIITDTIFSFLNSNRQFRNFKP